MKKLLSLLISCALLGAAAVQAQDDFVPPEATVPSADTAPMIDGVKDAAWDNAASVTLGNVIELPSKAPLPRVLVPTSDLDATAYMLYDDDFFYVLVDVTDDVINIAEGSRPHGSEGIEFYFDANDARGTIEAGAGWNDNDAIDDKKVAIFAMAGEQPIDVETCCDLIGDEFVNSTAVVSMTDTGYMMEVAFAWEDIGGYPSDDGQISFDVHINDDDGEPFTDDEGNVENRSHKLTWSDEEDGLWGNNKDLAGVVLFEGAAIPTVMVPFVEGGVTVDGVADDAWLEVNPTAMEKVIELPSKAPLPRVLVPLADLDGNFRAIYDVAGIYMWIEVTDNIINLAEGQRAHGTDGIEFYWDANNARGTIEAGAGWNDNDTIDDSKVAVFAAAGMQPFDVETCCDLVEFPHDNSEAFVTMTDTGYIMEVFFAWESIGGVPVDDGLVGFDVHINDDDGDPFTDDEGNVENRSHKLTWSDGEDASWGNRKDLMGQLMLIDYADNLTAPPVGVYIPGAVVLEGDWEFVEPFGSYNRQFAPWIYHPEHNFLWMGLLEEPDASTDSFYFYHADLASWIFTGLTGGFPVYPEMYVFAVGTWGRYEFVDGERRFVRYDNGEVVVF